MLELVKLALRIKSTAYDAEIETLIESARADMRASGIDTPNARATDAGSHYHVLQGALWV